MAQIILSSRYIKNPKKVNAGKLVKYMGTREGVEKLSKGIESKPATKKQQELINTITNRYPETKDYLEYKDYDKSKTKSSATEFIDAVVERNADRAEQLKSLVSYMAQRPSVEKIGRHGLFSATDDEINLDEVADRVSNHDGIVWTHVISLTREDAERLGYNNAEAWKNLVRRNEIEIANAHKISQDDIEWYGAFHNTTHHPHIHLLVYSKSGQGYLTAKAIKDMKSSFANDIFRNERYKLFKEQTAIRNELKDEFNSYLNQIKNGDIVLSDRMLKLVNNLKTQLNNYKGKKVYGYLPNKMKRTVDQIQWCLLLDNEDLYFLYHSWNDINNKKLSTYYDSKNNYVYIINNKEFRSVKNAIIKAIDEMDITDSAEQSSNVTNVINDLTRLLANMLSLSAEKKMKSLNSQSIDQKQMQMILDKKQARGQRDGVSKNDKKEVDESKSQTASQNLEALFELGAMMIRKAVSHNNDYDTDYESNYEEEQGFDLTM